MAISVMSYNARMDTTQPDGSDGSDGADAWPHRRELLLENIRAADPDLLGMQEVLPHMGEWLRRKLEPLGYAFAGEPRGGDGTGEMMATFWRASRFEALQEPGHLWLSDTPAIPGSMGPGYRCERMCTWVRLRDRAVCGRTVLFVDTHLDLSDSARVHGAQVITAFLRDQVQGSESVILTGDMNASDDSGPIAELTSGDLCDTFRKLHKETSHESTFHGFFPPYSAAQLKKHGAANPDPTFGRRIDYVLASESSLRVVGAEIDRFEDKGAATSQGGAVGQDGGGRFGRGRFPSDHHAVTAWLEYRDTAAL